MTPTPELLPESNKRKNIMYDLFAAIIFALLLYVAQYVAMAVASIIFGGTAVAEGVAESELPAYLTTKINTYINEILIAADLLIVGILVLWFGCRKKSIPKSLEMNRVKLGWVFMGIVAGIGLSFALSRMMSFVEAFFPKTMQEYNEHMGTTASGSAVAYVLAGVVLAPIVEELLFRALSLKYLDRVLPRGVAIFLIAGIFGLMHNNLIQALYAGGLGVLLCAFYFAFNSVWIPMAVHFGFNLVSVLSLVNTANMSETQMIYYAMFIQLFSLLAIAGGVLSVIYLFTVRSHSIWFKPRKQAEAVEALPEEGQ